MKSIWSRMVICSVLTCLVLGTAALAEGQKIAVIDMARVIRAYPDTATAQSILIKQKEDFEKQHEGLVSKGEALKEKFEELRAQAESSALNEDARKEKVREARAIMNQLVELEKTVRENARDRRKELTDEEIRLMKRIYEAVGEKIEAYIKENDFALVLNSAATGVSGAAMVIYSSDEVDVTTDIIKITGGTEPEEAEDTKE